MYRMHSGFLIIAVALVIGSLFLASCQTGATPTEALSATTPETTTCPAVEVPEVPEVTVDVAISPYVDQSEIFHGVEQGFYNDLGITVGPEKYGLNVQYDQVPSVLASNRVDIAKFAVSSIVPALEQSPGLINMSYSDLFVGFAIMCQPDGGFKTVKEFQAEGKDLDTAIAEAAKQLVGKTFVFAPEPSPLVLIDPAFAKAGISLEDMEVIRVQDPQGLALMESGEADCQLPGAPVRITLESLGYKPVIDMMDVGQAAKPSVDSPELRALSLNGYTTTKDFWEKNRDTVLRFASVGWRINDYINEDISRAVAAHIPFVNQLAGTSMTEPEGMAIYTKLDPFFTIDDQKEWFEDENSVFYQSRLIDAQILGFEESGELEPGKYTYKDISIAEEVYKAMMGYKADAEDAFTNLDTLGVKPGGEDLSTAEGLYAKAKQYYEWRDYLDAARFAEAAMTASCQNK